jgi:hypothetical protein
MKKFKLCLVCLLGASVAYAELPRGESVNSQRKVADFKLEAPGIAKSFAGALKGELLKAMNSGGLIAAAQYCSAEAMPLTENFAASFDEISISRVSRRFRNPNNAPDALDIEALEKLEQNKDLKELFLSPEGEAERYYMPLYTSGLCLSCHGSNIDSDLDEFLSSRYPNDRARGFAEGDFRGAVRIQYSPGNS